MCFWPPEHQHSFLEESAGQYRVWQKVYYKKRTLSHFWFPAPSCCPCQGTFGAVRAWGKTPLPFLGCKCSSMGTVSQRHCENSLTWSKCEGKNTNPSWALRTETSTWQLWLGQGKRVKPKSWWLSWTDRQLRCGSSAYFLYHPVLAEVKQEFISSL